MLMDFLSLLKDLYCGPYWIWQNVLGEQLVGCLGVRMQGGWSHRLKALVTRGGESLWLKAILVVIDYPSRFIG